MSWIVTLILLMVVLTYIVFGGIVFHVLEGTHEDDKRARLHVVLRQFLGQSHTHTHTPSQTQTHV